MWHYINFQLQIQSDATGNKSFRRRTVTVLLRRSLKCCLKYPTSPVCGINMSLNASYLSGFTFHFNLSWLFCVIKHFSNCFQLKQHSSRAKTDSFRLKDEAMVCQIIEEVENYLRTRATDEELCRIYLKRIQHLYYKVKILDLHYLAFEWVMENLNLSYWLAWFMIINNKRMVM